jgi:hypothetical protein
MVVCDCSGRHQAIIGFDELTKPGRYYREAMLESGHWCSTVYCLDDADHPEWHHDREQACENCGDRMDVHNYWRMNGSAVESGCNNCTCPGFEPHKVSTKVLDAATP